MANKDDYLAVYQRFFECFAQTVNPNDQLPVRLASYNLVNLEVVGGIIDWTTQYLTQKQCPPSLLAPLIKIIIDEIRKNCTKNPIDCGYNTNAEVYEPLKLMQAVMAKTNEVCLRYMDNSMLCSLPTPGPPHYAVSVAAIKNGRRTMEDRHVVIHDLNTMFNIQEASPSSYYAIFDGHAGHDAAAYSAVHLHQYLAESKYFVKNPEQALIDAFYKTDDLFIHKEEFCSGTTAVCALLKPKERMLYIAWVGDSQALIVSKGELNQCVNPHKPGRKDEKDRIEQQGGVVLFWGTWRVNGQLAVSRAIGDRQYKPYVTAIPEVKEIPITANTDFVILACDGLWDFLCEDKAARIVYNAVCTNTEDIDSISQRLVEQAKIQGSNDNISVIVVFLREPSKVAADAHWANRNTTTKMEAGLDNANATNNPFANSNGAEILQQKDDFLLNQPKDDFLLNLTEGFKQNGGQSPTANNRHFTNFDMNPSNGKRQSLDEFDEDEDMGPETDVDTVDDIPSPVDAKQVMFHQDNDENQKENTFNPFTDIEEKETCDVDIDLELQKQQSVEFEVQESMREETPTPPGEKVNDGTVEENVADSGEESEDEWNYFKGNSAEAETSTSSLKTDQEVAELTKTIEEDEEQDMSQLNPNAAEFVPISSPTRNISSPACRALIDDKILAQSPRATARTDIDINVPNPSEFASEVKSRPGDIFNNSHDNENGHKLSSQEVMENLLNGKNLDEIEFYPSTPSKIAATNLNTDEFHFGPNATPFSTPAKPLDQSEALSTKAIFGDESTASYLEGTTLESPRERKDDETITSLKLKEQDPMSMSFYQDENEHNPFDLNEVQNLPDDLDEFIAGTDNVEKHEQDDKENLNPESNQYLLGVSELPKTPEPECDLEVTNEKDVEKVCDLPPTISPTLEEIAKQPLPITPEPTESLESQNISEEEKVETFEKDEFLQQDDVVSDSFEQKLIEEEPKQTEIEKENVKESEEPDFVNSSLATSNLLPPTADLLSSVENNLPTTCDIKKMPELDSAPDTEELSQISDAGDEIPPLCKSPEMVSDLDQFESDMKEVIQEASQVFESVSQIEGILDDVAETAEKIANTVEEVVKEDKDAIEEAIIGQDSTQENVTNEVCENTNAVFNSIPISSAEKQESLHGEPDIVTALTNYDNIEPLEKIETEISEPIETKSQEAFGNTKYSENLFDAPDEKPKEEEKYSKYLDMVEDGHISEFESRTTTLDHGENITRGMAELIPEIAELDKEIVLTESEKAIELTESDRDLALTESERELVYSPEPSNEILMKTDIDLEEKFDDKISEDMRDLDSPMEDVTTSIKDDVSTSEIIEEAKDISTEKDMVLQDNFGITNNDILVEKMHVEERIGDVHEKLGVELMSPEPNLDEKVKEEIDQKVESVQEEVLQVIEDSVKDVLDENIQETVPQQTQEVVEDNKILEQEVLAPSPVVPPAEEPLILEDVPPTEEIKATPTPQEPTVELIKTDIITPQYPEETTLITPSEEIKEVIPPVEAEIPLETQPEVPPPQEEIKKEKEPEIKEDTTAAVTAAIVGGTAAVAAAATTAVAVTKSKEKKSLTPEKKPSATKRPSSASKPPATTVPSKTSKPPTKPSTPKSAPATTKPPAAAKTSATAKPLAAKSLASSQPKPTSRPSSSSKPAKPEPAAAKTIEKKSSPIHNGEVKSSLAKPSMASKKLAAAPRTPTGTRPLPTKSSPTKSEPKVEVIKAAPKPPVKAAPISKTTMVTTKPRPTTLTSTSRTVPPIKSTLKPATATSPKLSSSPARASRPPLSASTMSKPKTPVSAKGPDAEKQLKDTVNKQLITSTRTTVTKTGTAPGKTTTTATRRIETSKSSTAATRTTTTTRTTMTKTTKKPAEITKLANKAKPATKTATRTPQQNGTIEQHHVVTTVVQETTAILTAEPQLVKDLSPPIENKFITDNLQQVTERNVD